MTEVSEEELRARLYERYAAQREVEGNFRKVEQLMTVLLILCLLLMLYVSYSKVRSNYTAEQFAPHLNEQVEFLAPRLLNGLARVAEDVLPVYAAQATEWFPEIVPELEKSFGRELGKLDQHVRAQLRRDFDMALERSGRQLHKKLKARFPEIMTPEGRKLVEYELLAMIEQDSPQLLERFLQTYHDDIDKLYETLDGFRPNRFDKFEDEELLRYYAHLWLMAVDQELMGVE